jgi:hypothetical protein
MVTCYRSRIGIRNIFALAESLKLAPSPFSSNPNCMAFDNGGVADVRSQLERQAGVRPSSHWLEDCQRELQCSGGSVSADAVLEQILHHDLRDVVREFVEPSPQSPGPPNGTTSCAVQLRKAIQVSQPSHAESDQRSSNSSHKATLSASFRWMVQVEELLDISHNAEARLQVGPASPNAPTPIGNQRKRLLKMCLSDGCYGDGRVFETNSPENSLISSSRPGPSSILSIIGMEISPIPSLSVNTLAGTKLVLQGPITIRHGVMLLHAGNTIVLGGSVPELVEIQISALQQAKRMAGVGVDPTIRALVWNPEAQVGLGGDDEGTYNRCHLWHRKEASTRAPSQRAQSLVLLACFRNRRRRARK